MRDSKTEILNFWFEETKPEQWFQASEEFDRAITDRFEKDHEFAMKGMYDTWMHEPEGCLALILLLDQFSRNMFRGTPKAFASDEKALSVAKHTLDKGYEQFFPPAKRGFIFLPYEHSENLADQDRAVELFATIKADQPVMYDYALKHREVIQEYGRFPHRNQTLGRESTPEEKEYLSQPDAGF